MHEKEKALSPYLSLVALQLSGLNAGSFLGHFVLQVNGVLRVFFFNFCEIILSYLIKREIKQELPVYPRINSGLDPIPILLLTLRETSDIGFFRRPPITNLVLG